MTTFNDRFPGNLPDLVTGLHTFDEVGVDPDFDSDIEELDREFAELRFVAIAQAIGRSA